jgi:uncharacterized protein (TIGR02996 family)
MKRRMDSKQRLNFAAMAQFPSYAAPKASRFLNPPPFVKPTAPVLPPAQRELLDRVLYDPDADGPRRDYADWLDRHGDPERAAFIRDQLAGRDAIPNPAWAAEFEPWCARDLVYRRGFVEAMSLSARAYLSLGEPLFLMTPLREVRLVAVSPYLAELRPRPNVKLIYHQAGGVGLQRQ